MLASKTTSKKISRIANWSAIVLVGLNVGCCQVMVQQSPSDATGAPWIGCVEAEQCESAETHLANRWAEAKGNMECRKLILADKLRGYTQIASDRMHACSDNVTLGWDRCSSSLSDRMHQSRLAQWADAHRAQLNAPPTPRFHPLPTHPVFFPADDEARQILATETN